MGQVLERQGQWLLEGGKGNANADALRTVCCCAWVQGR